MKINKTILLLSFGLGVVLGSCKKDPEFYTLRGQVYNATTKRVCPGINLHAWFEKELILNRKGENRDLGWAVTDSNGHFLFEYEEFKGRGFFSLEGDSINAVGLDYNENVDIRIYRSDLGTRRLRFQTTSPLGNTDTLFVASEEKINGKWVYDIDTFLNIPSSFIKDYRKPPNSQGVVYWGRGARNLVISYNTYYDSYHVDFRQGAADAGVTGDPVIDEVIINY